MSEIKPAPARRNLSGVYIFDTFPDDEKRQPTCVEDCTEPKRDQWLLSLEDEALRQLNGRLLDCCSRAFAMCFERQAPEYYRDEILGQLLDYHGNGSRADILSDSGYLCRLLRRIGDEGDIIAASPEETNDNKTTEK